MAKKVLIVEDNELKLRLFRDLLEAHGAELRTIRDAREALAAMRAFLPQLVIMDIQLPLLSGVELMRIFKEDPALDAVPVMAVTAYAGKGDEGRVRQAGADAYVSKPISVARFVTAVESLAGPLGGGFKRAG